MPFSVNQTTATDILDIDDYEKSRNFRIQYIIAKAKSGKPFGLLRNCNVIQ